MYLRIIIIWIIFRQNITRKTISEYAHLEINLVPNETWENLSTSFNLIIMTFDVRNCRTQLQQENWPIDYHVFRPHSVTIAPMYPISEGILNGIAKEIYEVHISISFFVEIPINCYRGRNSPVVSRKFITILWIFHEISSETSIKIPWIWYILLGNSALVPWKWNGIFIEL